MASNEIIDLHLHGWGYHDTRSGRTASIIGLAAQQGRAGVTAILPTIYSGTIEAMRSHMDAVRRAREVQRSQRPKSQAKILGVHLEGPFLNPVRAGAQDAKSLLKPTMANLEKLVDGYEDLVKVITIAPELPGALKAIETCAAMGVRVNMGHSDATLAQSLEGKRAGATGVTHIFNAMRPFHHREPGLAGAGLMDPDLYIEVIPDGVHLSPDTIRFIFATKPAGRIILVSDSIKGAQYKKGVLQGSIITLARGVKILRSMGIGEREVDRAVRINPRRYMRGH